MLIDSNLKEVLVDIEKKIGDKLEGKPLSNLLNDISVGLLRTMKRRIHSDGLNTAESSIGNYSTDPMYANPKDGAVSVGLANKGKTGRTKFTNGTDHKTRYYSKGYKEWRGANRRVTNKVNLVFKGDLTRSFTFVKKSDLVFAIGFNNDENFEKAKHIEQHFGTSIWGVGNREEKIIDDTINSYLNKL